MPWLAGTALLHSAIVVEKRDALKVWTILLAILTFSLSLMGTFLVRSGVLTSVHAFAVDPARGSFILAIMALFTGGALALFASRAPALKMGGLFAPISREGGLILNNLLLTTACATVFVGTLYPLALEAVTGSKISVGAPFFNATFGPLMVPLLIALPIGPFMAWKRGDLRGALQRMVAAIGFAFLAIIVVFATVSRGPILAPFGIGLAFWIIIGALSEMAFRIKLFKTSSAESWRRLRNLPGASWGMTIAHVGMGVTVLGIVATSAWRIEKIVAMKPGESVTVSGYELTFRGVQPQRGPNYIEQMATLDVRKDGEAIVQLKPSKRRYPVENQATSEAGIYNALAGDLYVILGDELKEGAYTVRVYFNPLVRLIWIGTVFMFLAGAFSLFDRRLRVGAPRKVGRRRRMPAPAE